MNKNKRTITWSVIITLIVVCFLSFGSGSTKKGKDIDVLNESMGIGEVGADNIESQNHITDSTTVTDSVYETIYKEKSKQEQKNEIDYSLIKGLTEEKKYGKKLVEDKSRNILIIGEDKEAHLYDTIGIISIDQASQSVKIIMIPRDTHISYNKKVLKALSDNGKLGLPGVYKINYAHHIGVMMKYEGDFMPFTSISFLADVIKEKFGISIDDFIKINTEGFEEAVKIFDGVDIDVPYYMNYDDPFQNLSIHLEKGYQHINGEQALGFVRFRQGYDKDGNFIEYGDIERKKNQIAFIRAFFEQHGTIKNVDKIPQLMQTLNKNIRYSIGVKDIFNYTGLIKDIIVKEYDIESVTLTGELKMIDGVSYLMVDTED